jgi:hypothetical protein
LKKLLLVVALLLAWPTVGLSQAGQVIPRVALFGGFTRVFDKADPNSFSVGSFHFDGGEASGEVRVSRWAGIVGDYGWQWSNRDGQAVAQASLLPTGAHSQSVPSVRKYTVFGGFTTVRNRFDHGPLGSIGPGPAFYVSGWAASIERKVAPRIGIVADFSQQYGTRTGGPFVGAQQENQTFALFGPQVSLRATHRVIPFAHVLLGPSYGTTFLEYLSEGPSTDKVFDFTTAVGGGVDIKIMGPVWIRAVQVDYLNAKTDFGGDHAPQLRISAGIAFRF